MKHFILYLDTGGGIECHTETDFSLADHKGAFLFRVHNSVSEDDDGKELRIPECMEVIASHVVVAGELGMHKAYDGPYTTIEAL